jgi:Tol biopolymer transport system component
MKVAIILTLLSSAVMAGSAATIRDVVFRCGDGLYTARSDDTGSRLRLTLSEDESPKWNSGSKRIVFSRFGEIWSIRPDGGDPRQITSPQEGGVKIHPSLSPDGSKLLYVLTDWWDYFHLYLANGDGSSPVRITSADREFSPDWSPDGRRFAVAHQFGSGNPSYIYIYDADGTNRVALTGGHDRYD